MSSTGYTDKRATEHDLAVEELTGILVERGLDVTPLGVDGHNPDLDLGFDTLVDVKTSYSENRNMSVEIPCFSAWDRLEAIGKMILIVYRDRWGKWWVDTPRSLTARIQGGPNRPTGKGSEDNWYLIINDDKYQHGTPLDDWFYPNVPGDGRLGSRSGP